MSSVQKSVQCLLLWTTFLSVAAPPLKVLKPDGSCSPGELVWVECNLCTCNPQGRPNQVCASMWCQPVPTTSKPHGHQMADRDSLHQYSGVVVETRRRADTVPQPHRPQPQPQPLSTDIHNRTHISITEIDNNNLPNEPSTTHTTQPSTTTNSQYFTI